MTEYYKSSLEEGQEYQDYVVDQLLRYYGWPLIIYQSKAWQRKGETSSGVEIKYDKRCAETGNLYIEVAEKPNKDHPTWYPSGIYRKDNSFFYLIGTFDEAYLLSKPQLQRIYENRGSWSRLNIIEAENPTSKGFLFPKKDAEDKGYVLRKFPFFLTEGSNKYPSDVKLPWDNHD